MAKKKTKKKPGRPKKGPAKKSATFRLPEELLIKLAAAAEEQERAQATLVRRAIEFYLKAQSGQ